MSKMVQDYLLTDIIGQGQFGKVWKAQHTKTNETFAMKAISLLKVNKVPKFREFLASEINVLDKIKSKHIVKYFGKLHTENNMYLIFEFCDGGTLEDVLVKKGKLEQEEALRYFKELLEAFKVLNEHNVMHRDLKPSNVLFDSQGMLKLADFGFCKKLRGKYEMTKSIVGSPIYMAPELLQGRYYGFKADVWSLGVMLYEMIFGKCPYEENSIPSLINLIKRKPLTFIGNVTESNKTLLKKMLKMNPTERVSFEELFEFNIEREPRNSTLGGSYIPQLDHEASPERSIVNYSNVKRFEERERAFRPSRTIDASSLNIAQQKSEDTYQIPSFQTAPSIAPPLHAHWRAPSQDNNRGSFLESSSNVLGIQKASSSRFGPVSGRNFFARNSPQRSHKFSVNIAVGDTRPAYPIYAMHRSPQRSFLNVAQMNTPVRLQIERSSTDGLYATRGGAERSASRNLRISRTKEEMSPGTGLMGRNGDDKVGPFERAKEITLVDVLSQRIGPQMNFPIETINDTWERITTRASHECQLILQNRMAAAKLVELVKMISGIFLDNEVFRIHCLCVLFKKARRYMLTAKIKSSYADYIALSEYLLDSQIVISSIKKECDEFDALFNHFLKEVGRLEQFSNLEGYSQFVEEIDKPFEYDRTSYNQIINKLVLEIGGRPSKQDTILSNLLFDSVHLDSFILKICDPMESNCKYTEWMNGLDSHQLKLVLEAKMQCLTDNN